MILVMLCCDSAQALGFRGSLPASGFERRCKLDTVLTLLSAAHAFARLQELGTSVYKCVTLSAEPQSHSE